MRMKDERDFAQKFRRVQAAQREVVVLRNSRLILKTGLLNGETRGTPTAPLTGAGK